MKIIRASEIGDYIFCHRAWWLKHMQGHASANVRELAEGTAAHTAHGRAVWAASALRGLALLLCFAALLFWILNLGF